jgi:chemotaxis signal transduction protein
MTPLLICSVGPYALRQRPVAVGLPLEGAVTVRPMGPLMPLPGQTPTLLGLTMHEGQIVPVYALAALVGLANPGEADATEIPPYVVVLKMGTGLVGFAVAGAGGTERPLHTAAPDVLLPIANPAIVGALPTRGRWVAVVDPARLAVRAPIAV